jgi:hypothetical protein
MGRRRCHAPEQSRDEEGLAPVISIFHPRIRQCDSSRQMRSAGTWDGRGTLEPGTHWDLGSQALIGNDCLVRIGGWST